MELPINSMKGKNFKKSSYVKADQIYYFDKQKTDYYILGTLKYKYIDKLLKLILKLNNEGKTKMITDNLWVIFDKKTIYIYNYN